MQKECTAILVPTKKPTRIWSNKGRRFYFDQANFNDPEDTIYYHLHIVSKERVEDGDLCIIDQEKVERYHEPLADHRYRRIIASTDKRLRIRKDITSQTSAGYDSSGVTRVIIDGHTLPGIADSYIEEFVRVGVNIQEVKVEVEFGAPIQYVNEDGERVENYPVNYKVTKRNNIKINY